ncbi:MAG TPA: helix-turn-helix domain-containing protein [Terriglobales bacterium]|nr:helix-turn-helix domain-containing protein [Terriglobales bacterium]
MSKKYGKPTEVALAHGGVSQLLRNVTPPISARSELLIPARSCHANEDEAFDSQPHDAPSRAVSAGQFEVNSSHLLTIRQVADLLQVPVSWVYGRTRTRSLERIPGYRLGKYWRFDRSEVLVWVARHKTTREAA